MKTIKELEEMYNKSRMSYYWLGYEKALKDVLKLIDEMMCVPSRQQAYINKLWNKRLEELKSKIKGESFA